MVPTWRVLIFPGATEIALELRQSLAWCKEVELFSAGSIVSNHAPFAFARHFVVPWIYAADWLPALQELIADEGITHIFPAHDDVLLALAENAGQLAAKIITSPLETCRITRSKLATLCRLMTTVPTAKVFASPQEITDFPVFLKPDKGQGSQRTACAHSRQELMALLIQDADRMIFENLPGSEFTVDCFSDRQAGLLYASGRERRRIRSGISMNSTLAHAPLFVEYAERICKELEFHGAWFFQVKGDSDGLLKLMEVAPRIAGTSALSRARGVNLPLLSLYEAERIPIRVTAGNHEVEIDRALVNRYRHNLACKVLYIDFDDTIVIRGRVNVELVKLLYDAANKGVRLVLLTRYPGDLRMALHRCRLQSLFDEVINLRDGELKSDFVQEKEAIFIDDSFSERLDVYVRTGTPVFDPSMIEVLFDDRV